MGLGEIGRSGPRRPRGPSGPPFVVGGDLPWKEAVGLVWRVTDFDMNGTTVDQSGGVHARSVSEPYGILSIEGHWSPWDLLGARRSDRGWLPVTHRTDFLLALSVFGEPQFASALDEGEAELLVTYVPKRSWLGGFAGATHALHYVLAPPGTHATYCHAAARPPLERLFGPLRYDGEVAVAVLREPLDCPPPRVMR